MLGDDGFGVGGGEFFEGMVNGWYSTVSRKNRGGGIIYFYL
jgi:hypothetical protein